MDNCLPNAHLWSVKKWLEAALGCVCAYTEVCHLTLAICTTDNQVILPDTINIPPSNKFSVKTMHYTLQLAQMIILSVASIKQHDY